MLLRKIGGDFKRPEIVDRICYLHKAAFIHGDIEIRTKTGIAWKRTAQANDALSLKLHMGIAKYAIHPEAVESAREPQLPIRRIVAYWIYDRCGLLSCNAYRAEHFWNFPAGLLNI